MKWRSSFYFRLVLSYTLLALVLIGITGGILVTNANKIMTGEVTKDARYGLLNVKDMVENNFLRLYEDSFFNKVLTTVNQNSNEDLNYLLQRPAEGSVSRIVKLITDLGLIEDMTDGLEGITVYMRKGGYALDQDHYYASLPGNSKDAAFISRLADIEPNRWFLREKPGGPDAPGQRVMTYVFTLPYYSSPANASAFLYLDISVVHLQGLMQSMVNFPQAHLYLFDEHGELIAGDGSAAGQVTAVRGALAELSADPQGESFKRFGNSVISVLPASDSLNGWHYAIVRPLDSFLLSADKIKRQVMTACLLALLGGLAISFLMSRHFYMPLKKLLYSLRNLYNGPPPAADRHEYAAIDHMLRFIDLSMVRMKDEVRSKQIAALLTGQQTAAGSGELPAIPLECGYAVACLATGPEAARLLPRLVAETSGLAAELVPLSATETAMLVYLYGDERLDATARIAAALASLRPALQPHAFGAGIGGAADSIEEIHRSYLEAVQAGKYAYVYGKDAIVRHEDIAADRERTLLPSVGYDALRNKIQAGSAGETEKWMEELLLMLQAGRFSLETIEWVCLRIETVLSEVVLEHKLQDALPIFGVRESLRQPTLEETMASLQARAAQIAKHIDDSRSDVQHEKIAGLKAYIVEHMAEDLSLEELANKANLSANYVSTLFGSISGESFTEYLNRVRLEHAAGLLIEGGRMTVAEIATSVGYRNSQYFCTKFKARFGVTPLQYRSSGGGLVEHRA